jgi:hypothetical protein
MGLMEIALNQGRAAFLLEAHVGTAIRVSSAGAAHEKK